MSKLFLVSLFTIFSAYGYLGLRVNTYKYDIRLYGIIFDSTVDNTSGFQRAIDSCNTQTGGTVFIPAFTYLIDSLIKYPKYELKGEGYGSVLKANSATTDGMIQEINTAIYNSGDSSKDMLV